MLGDFEAGQLVGAGLLRAGQPFAVVVGLGADRLPVLAGQPDHFQQFGARRLAALRLGHRPVDQMDEGDEVGDAPLAGETCRRSPSSSGTSVSCMRQLGLREQHVEALVEGLAEIMRQPEIGLRHQEVGIALQPVAVGAVEAEDERAAALRVGVPPPLDSDAMIAAALSSGAMLPSSLRSMPSLVRSTSMPMSASAGTMASVGGGLRHARRGNRPGSRGSPHR